MNRRTMFGFLSVSPVAAVGAVMTASRPMARDVGPTDDVPSLTLYHQAGHAVVLAPGRDGGLWLRIKDRWVRVVTSAD